MADHLLQLWISCLELSHALEVDAVLVQGNDGVCVHPGECICWSVVRSTDVANVGGKLGHEVKMSCLSRGMTIVVDSEGEGERSMVCENVEFSTLNKMPEVFDGQVHCQKFPVEGAVPGLCWL